MNLVHCVIFVATLFFSSINAQLFDLATAECVNIKECAVITTYLINAKQPLSKRTMEVLRKLRCGSSDGSVMVYCPKNSTKDIMAHKNSNLLPKQQCGFVQLEDRIINGNRSNLFEFPWMVLLSYQIGKIVDFRCGGTLINDRYVLTAAHCITDLNGKTLLGVRVGEYDRDSAEDCDDEVCADPVQDVQIEETIPHPNYDIVSREFDIGLLRLDKTINVTTASVRPICLPLEPEIRNINSMNGTVTGWGQTENARHSGILLKVLLPLVPREECRSIYEKQNFTIKENRYCAGGDGKSDSCAGDSGGPMQVKKFVYGDIRYVQYGIVSIGPRICAMEGLPAVYTNVTSNLEWILDNMRL